MLKRLEKYTPVTTSGGWPQRISLMLDGQEVGEIYVREGEIELRAPHPSDGSLAEVFWSEQTKGWGSLDASERDHYMHECIRRLDAIIDPDGKHGALDPDEPVPEKIEAAESGPSF